MNVEISDTRYINDNIHGNIPLSDLHTCFIDTPQFQRLREIKQTSTAYYVFPGASHNRFEHCLGVGYLSGKWIKAIQRRQKELNVTFRDVSAVVLAGFCHDLGHGPFSHAFEQKFLPQVLPEGITWKHEEGSMMMIEALVEENHIDIEADDVKFIKSLVMGAPKAGEKLFLYDIVANQKNGVDVDKFDYISRDCYNIGIKTGYDSSRLLDFSSVIEDHISFHQKEVYNIYEMFHTRYSLHKRVYSHKVSCSIENMMMDALLEAEPFLKISESIFDPQKFLTLTDNIIHRIEYSQDPELASSRKILSDIRTRNIYQCVGEIVMNHDLACQMRLKITPQEIVSFQMSGSKLRASDVFVDWITINYGMNHSNPVDNVQFYARSDPTQAFGICSRDVSNILPVSFHDNIVRVYCKDRRKSPDAEVAFHRFKDKFLPKGHPPH